MALNSIDIETLDPARTIVVATGNAHKLVEIEDILSRVLPDVTFVALGQLGDFEDPEETGTTFLENALIKARAISKETGCLVLADDSGLEVDYMDKAPGIYSARFLGEDTSYRIKNQYIIDKLAGVPDPERTARFVCAIAAVFPDGSEYTTRGTIEGIIGYEERGENGFGYDPIFFLPEKGKTTAELDPEEKNDISHRGNALRLMKDVIRKHRENN